jgi:hypothetical protein
MTNRKGVFRGPNEGRSYPMGSITATYKADGEETESNGK